MLYLASQSPQRSTLLSGANIALHLINSNCDEEAIVHDHPQATAIERAL
ncbi:MAG: Maf family protein, partial [Planctomycetes bacterium]|nr:Maf family protein [Planctomycetota bacterium]